MLADFTKLKKYNLNDPAWYNNIVLELDQKARQEGKNLLYIQHYLLNSNGNLDELNLKLGINITLHPDLPLAIFNYDHVKTPHDSLIALECRGLTLERDTWNIVAKPMNRFFNWEEVDIPGAKHPNLDKRQFDFSNFITQSKEDGSLMVMYYYKDRWMLNTRTFFLNTEARRKIIMSGIHENYADKVIEVFLKALHPDIKSLSDMDKFLNRDHTYCFEYCTQLNKIVRTYEQDTVFLLSITDNKSLKEFPTEDIDKIAGLIGASRPKDYELKSFDAITKAMKEVICKDPSLEGFVIKDVNGSRWKIKSPSYFFLHHISYDKMRTPYPKDLVPLILQGEGTELFSILEVNGFTAELLEVQQQWKFCEERLKGAWEQLKKEWEMVINIENSKEFEKAFSKLSTPLANYIRELYQTNRKTLADLEQLWYSSPETLIAALFTKEEQRPANVRKAAVKVDHIADYVKAQDRERVALLPIFKDPNWWKKVNEENDGLAHERPKFEGDKWLVHCSCGGLMHLYSVPEYWYDYKCIKSSRSTSDKSLHCGYCKESIIDKKKQQGALQGKGSNAILTYQCECGLSHRAHQHQKKIENELKRRPLKGKPLGIPCSELCLCMRHKAHEEIEIVMEQFKWDRDTIYKEASRILDVNTEDSHVGMLGISQCRELILQFREMRGEDV